jgi:hypothetical protein
MLKRLVVNTYNYVRTFILTKFPILRNIKKYNLAIPIFKKLLIWPILKPNKLTIFEKVFYLSTKEYSNPSRDLYSYRNIYSDHEKKILEKKIKPGDNCIDIGSNIGFFTWMFLSYNKGKGKVFCFESNLVVYEILKKNFINDKTVKTYLGLVGINNGNNKFIVIDELIKERIDFIKIDIDGPDLNALKSCENIIDKYEPKIIIELSEASYREHGINYTEVIFFLKEKKYEIYEIDKNLTYFDRRLKHDEVINVYAEKI